jgi:putative DNA primase/helicase
MTEDQNPMAVVVAGAAPIPESLDAAVVRLAALTPLEYDRVREAEADKLGVRKPTLDAEVAAKRTQDKATAGPKALCADIEPWGEGVDGAALLDDIHTALKRYVVCDAPVAVAATLWIAFTWIIDHVQVAPLAVITAPEKGCGKSTLLAFIGKLVRRPLPASNISPSAIFRVVEAHGPTLLIDEAETFLRNNEEARGILNSGHTRDTAFVVRNVGDDHTPTHFTTWGAKALCGIGHLPDTLMSRAIVLSLRRKLKTERVERLRHADPALFARLAAQLARWAQDNGSAIGPARPALPDALDDRAQDNWEALLAIAERAGSHWGDTARKAALTLSGASKDDDGPIGTQLLAALRDAFEVKGTPAHLPSAAFLEYLCDDETAPWATYNRGKEIRASQVAKRLREYGITPRNKKQNRAVKKGYFFADCEDAFGRYLYAPHQGEDTAATAATIQENPYKTDA